MRSQRDWWCGCVGLVVSGFWVCLLVRLPVCLSGRGFAGFSILCGGGGFVMSQPQVYVFVRLVVGLGELRWARVRVA